MGIFGLEFEKAIAIFKTDTIEFVLLQCSVKKLKSLNLGPNVSNLSIFGVEFENNIVIFEINALEFVYLQSLVQK